MIPILYVRPEGMRFVVLVMNIISAITLICIMIYLLSAAGGAGPLLTEPSTVRAGSELGWSVVYSITTVSKSSYGLYCGLGHVVLTGLSPSSNALDTIANRGQLL